jgi:hypothetical protein
MKNIIDIPILSKLLNIFLNAINVIKVYQRGRPILFTIWQLKYTNPVAKRLEYEMLELEYCIQY